MHPHLSPACPSGGPNQGWRGPVRALVFLAALLPATAQATSLTVPDDVATIQAALDAGPDTVLVRAGVYPETPTMNKRTSIIAIGTPRPVLTGLAFSPEGGSNDRVHIVGLEFQTRVEPDANYSSDLPIVLFEDCHLVAGFREGIGEPGGTRIFRRCRVEGLIHFFDGGGLTVDSCDVEGGVRADHPDISLSVTRSRIHGSGVSGGVYLADVRENVVEGSIAIQALREVNIQDNLLRSGLIHADAEDGSVRVERNRLERGRIDAQAYDLVIGSNIVLDSPGSGIHVFARSRGTIGNNLVAGSAVHGLHIAGDVGESLIVSNNTSVSNRGCGYLSDCWDLYGPYEFTGNIGAGNGAHGVRWSGPAVTTVRLNDWFDNALGDVDGRPPSSQDLTLDPLFCDAANGDFHLASLSPLVDAPGHGRIGALGVGCYAPGMLYAAFHLTRVGPSPSGGRVNIEFEMPHAAAIEIEVFDILGRRVATPARGTWPAGRHSVAWMQGRAGVYLVRYRFPGGQEHRQVVRTP